jgi:hypothetical protein
MLRRVNSGEGRQRVTSWKWGCVLSRIAKERASKILHLNKGLNGLGEKALKSLSDDCSRQQTKKMGGSK